MNKKLIITSISAISFTLIFASIGISLAQTPQATVCADVTLSGAINGDVVVPAGTVCNLVGAQISGDVINDSTLFVESSSIIDGSINANNALFTAVTTSSVVKKDVIVKGSEGFRVRDVTIMGNFEAKGNGGDKVDIIRTTVQGNVDVSKNMGFALARISVSDNNIGGDLIVKGNTQVGPTTKITVSGNTVGGDATCKGEVDAFTSNMVTGKNKGCP